MVGTEIEHFLLRILVGIGLTALWLFCWFGFGAGLTARLGLRRSETGGFVLVSMTLGMGALSLLTLLAGALGLLYASLARILLACGGILAVAELLYNRRYYRGQVMQSAYVLRRGMLPLEWIVFVLLILSLLYPLMTNALIPPVSYDAAAYHLAIPRFFMESHRISYIPFIPYANWPLGAEMVSMLGLLANSETIAHLVSWGALLLTCQALWFFGNRYFGRPAGLVAATFFAATPAVATVAGTALVEVPFALFVCFAVVAFINWSERPDSRWWIFSAIFGGFAASMKLNGAIVPLVLGFLYATSVSLRQSRRISRFVLALASYGFISLAVVGPWYLKAYLQTGNPFWPFFIEFLGGRNWDTLGNEYLIGFIKLVNMPLTLSNWLLGLWHVTIRAQSFGPNGLDLGWPYLLLLPLVGTALLVGKSAPRRILLWLGIIGISFYTAWFLETHQTRFLIPSAPVFSLLIAGSSVYLSRMWGRTARLLIQLLLLACLVSMNWTLSPRDRSQIGSRWSFLAGSQTREEFLSKNVLGYLTFHYANTYLPRDSRVLLALYESRGYYLERDYMWMNPIGQRYLKLEQVPDAESLYRQLNMMGFTHVMFAPKYVQDFEYVRYGPHYTALILGLIQSHCRSLYQTPDLILCALQ